MDPHLQPVNGVVTKRQVQTGAAVVQMRNELMTLVSADTSALRGLRPGDVAFQLRPDCPGDPGRDPRPDLRTLREIIQVAGGRTVPSASGSPRTGADQGCRGRLRPRRDRGQSRTPVVSVPRAAVVSDEGQMAVYVVEHDKQSAAPCGSATPVAPATV